MCEINKEKDCPDYIPTKRELLELVKYWASERLDGMSFCFLWAVAGSDLSGRIIDATRRLNRLAEVLDDEAVFNDAHTQGENEFRTRIGEEDWRILTTNDTAERDRILLEFCLNEIEESIHMMLILLRSIQNQFESRVPIFILRSLNSESSLEIRNSDLSVRNIH